MSEPKFTKGPWKAKDNYIYAPIPDEDDIFAISIAVACAGVAPAISNANLIAAAPDMYEALEEVVALVCDSCLEYERFKELCHGRQKVVIAENPCNNCTNKVIKALRKARGERE